ncbi:MAG: hypothetical protein ABR537_12080 [Gemmatimonadales bacterium]
MRYDAFIQRLIDAVTTSDGATPPELRRAVMERRSVKLPAQLGQYVETVDRHAYRVTDSAVQALQQSGNSEDALFEITVSASLGAALHRLERGMAALRGQEPD